MEDYDYDRWCKYLEEIFVRRDIQARTIVDLACGTGNFTIGLKAKGYDIMGIDSSEDMLAVAMDKSSALGLSIPYINQDMRNLTLHGPVDVITCMCDGFNYILTDQDLISALQKIYKFLNEGGALIFDISSYYKLEHILGDNIMADASEDISLIWFNEFNRVDETCRMDLTFFVEDGNRYMRFDETHYQRAYNLEHILEILKMIGFKNIFAYAPFTFESAREDDQRWVFVVEK